MWNAAVSELYAVKVPLCCIQRTTNLPVNTAVAFNTQTATIGPFDPFQRALLCFVIPRLRPLVLLVTATR
jgi:hypothetical protein